MRRFAVLSAMAALMVASAPVAAFGDGTYVMGDGITPGTYRADGGDGCYWARLSGFDGTTEDIIESDEPSGPAVVYILSSDAGFETRGCGEWSVPSAAPTPSEAPPVGFGDGIHLVGSEVPAGIYRTDGGEGCYWARLSGFSGTTAEIIANDNATGPVVVEILSSDLGFQTERCGDWSALTATTGASPSEPPAATGLHGNDLLEFEIRMPGNLAVPLPAFIKAWNREVVDYEKTLVLPKKVRIEGGDGVRTFQHTFRVKGFMGGRVDNIGLLGRMAGGDVEMIALLWYRMPDQIMDGLNAVIALTSLPHAVDPGVTQDEVNALFEDLALPDDDFEGYEAQATLRGIQYTIADNGEGSTVMVARRIADE